jgi:hypothetical protein
MKVHYLEIVASDVDAVCAAYEAANGIPGKGRFAMYIPGDVNPGSWQL